MFRTFKKLGRSLTTFAAYDPDQALLNSAHDRLDLEMIERDIARRRNRNGYGY